MQRDKGTEFTNQVFQRFLRDHNVPFFTTEREDIMASVAEQINRMLKKTVEVFYKARLTTRYRVVLQPHASLMHQDSFGILTPNPFSKKRKSWGCFTWHLSNRSAQYFCYNTLTHYSTWSKLPHAVDSFATNIELCSTSLRLRVAFMKATEWLTCVKDIILCVYNLLQHLGTTLGGWRIVASVTHRANERKRWTAGHENKRDHRVFSRAVKRALTTGMQIVGDVMAGQKPKAAVRRRASGQLLSVCSTRSIR